MTTSQTLPDDILLHILNFLPERILRNMFAVSKVFYDAAMSSRYGELSLKLSDFGRDHKRRMESLSSLRDATVARFVRKLTVTVDKFPSSKFSSGEHHAYRNAESSRGAEEELYAFCISAWVEIWGRLPSVSTTHLNLLLNTWTGGLPEYLSPLLTNVWMMLGPTIEYLQLDAAVAQYQFALKAVPNLPALRSIKIGWRAVNGRHTSEEGSAHYSLLSTLITSVGRTLESIEFQPTDSLDGIGHLLALQPRDFSCPRLRHFSLALAADTQDRQLAGQISADETVDFECIGKFLVAHSPQLLSLHLDLPQDWYAKCGVIKKSQLQRTTEGQSPWEVPILSNIKSLHTNHFPSFDSCLNSLPRSHLSDITSLAIKGLTLTPAELGQLLQVHGSPSLTLFSINLEEFSADHLLLLASSLPALLALRIRVNAAGLQVHTFRDKLPHLTSSSALRTWPLASMEIEQLVPARSRFSGTALPMSFPSLVGTCCSKLEKLNGRNIVRVLDNDGNYQRDSVGALIVKMTR